MPAPGTASISPRIARSLGKLGNDLEIARKKRRLTVASLCQRAGISVPLYRRMVEGAAGTSIGAYAMVLFALGFGTPFDSMVDVARDDTGLLLDERRLPQRVRPPRNKTGAL